MELYIKKIDELENVDSLLKVLQKDRLSKYLSYKREQNRKQFLTAEYLIREYIGGGVIKENEFGKPYIKNHPYFNISHSNDYVVLAKNHSPIGCDIQYMKDIAFEGVANKVFTKDEFEYLKKNNYSKEIFYKIWTVKEAYLKFTGKGFYDDCKKISYDIVNNRIDNCNNLKIEYNLTIPNYIIAVVY